MYRLLFIFIAVFVCFSCNNNQNNVKGKFGLGLVFDDNAYRQIPKKAKLTRGIYVSLPSSSSLKQFCPEVQSQGQYSTCVGWASNYYGRTILYAKNNNITDKEEITKNSFSAGFLYKSIQPNDNECTQGSSLLDAMNVLKTIGSVKQSDFNYDCPSDIPADLFTKATNFKIDNFTRLFDVSTDELSKIEMVKKALSEENPVIIGLMCTPSFVDVNSEFWQSNQANETVGGHALCVIGYDDNKFNGAFNIINSWGTDWGDNGYVWISYADFAKYVRYGFEMIDKGKSNNKNLFSGKLRFVLDNGNEMPTKFTQSRGITVVDDIKQGNYKMINSYNSGTRFRLFIKNEQQAYVYALACDNNMNISVLFPYSSDISPLLNYSNSEVAIPDENHFMQLDQNIGTDLFCLLYSINPIDVQSLKTELLNRSGSFTERLANILSNQLVNKDEINYSNDQIIFNAQSNNSILSIIVSIIHN